MLRSLYAGISGLRGHQQMMDITGNNIANVNTAGFKSSSGVFEDTLSQMMKAAGAPQGNQGGTNPAQVGLGMRMAGISTNFSQGAAQTTGRTTDLMIQGDGFFVVRSGNDQLYSRAGSFSFDANGSLVTPEGANVRGWVGKNGVIDTNSPTQDVKLPFGSLLAPKPTDSVTVGGNLPADTVSAAPIVTSITTYDTQGNPVTLSASYTKTDATHWDVTLSDGVNPDVGPTPITFDAAGGNPDVTHIDFNGLMDVDVSGVTSYAGTSTIAATSQTGAAMGSLQSFTIGPDGTVVGVFSNGLKQSLAQLAISSFNNPPGLEKIGNSTYRATVNSGNPQLGAPGSAGRGALQAGALEMSNVDLAQEFTNLIVAERGFQANSKIISTSDE
ncbi:MAG: flagellar hook protein FlgE, partial [Cryptosporangiaceae bacterium]|nr:flagellar hook protein FlgE [Cryptosporangiaceae bacterium]